MELHPVRSAERAPAAEQPSGVVYGRQRVVVVDVVHHQHEEACPRHAETAETDERTYEPRESPHRAMPAPANGAIDRANERCQRTSDTSNTSDTSDTSERAA